VSVEPSLRNLKGVFDGGLLLFGELIGQLSGILNGIFHTVDVILETILGVNFFLLLLILISELLSILKHLLDFFLGQSSFIVSDNDFLDLIACLILSSDL